MTKLFNTYIGSMIYRPPFFSNCSALHPNLLTHQLNALNLSFIINIRHTNKPMLKKAPSICKLLMLRRYRDKLCQQTDSKSTRIWGWHYHNIYTHDLLQCAARNYICFRYFFNPCTEYKFSDTSVLNS
jgi:hypothetical protein